MGGCAKENKRPQKYFSQYKIGQFTSGLCVTHNNSKIFFLAAVISPKIGTTLDKYRGISCFIN